MAEERSGIPKPSRSSLLRPSHFVDGQCNEIFFFSFFFIASKMCRSMCKKRN